MSPSRVVDSMERIAIFPGSFDPFTNGHQDVVLRGATLFDKLIIGIGVNSNKNRYFSPEYMLERISFTFKETKNVEVKIFHGLTAEFAKKENAHFLLRGLRNTTDFEYEKTLAQANKHIFPDLETCFLITNPALASINSSIVRDLHKYKADVSNLLPYSLENFE